MNEDRECGCCRYKGVDTKEYNVVFGLGKRRLCRLCANTMTGQHDLQPDGEILKTICYVGNAILHELAGMEARRK